MVGICETISYGINPIHTKLIVDAQNRMNIFSTFKSPIITLMQGYAEPSMDVNNPNATKVRKDV